MSRKICFFFVSMLTFLHCLTNTTFHTIAHTNTPQSLDLPGPTDLHYDVRNNRNIKRYQKKYTGKQEAHHYISAIFHDTVELHKNLFAGSTLQVAAMVFPFFVGTRMFDERVQTCFYDKESHKNINYLPEHCHDIAQWSIAIPVVALGSQAFFGTSDEMRETSRAYLIGLPFVFWTKTLIKKIPFDANMRPWHEKYSCEQRSTGGFPSGHMAEATYTALLYGLRFGRRFAIPLGLLATFIGTSFIACNRHYLSQIVAGAGLGAVYSLAAYKLSGSKIKENMQVGLKIHKRGPAVAMSYAF